MKSIINTLRYTPKRLAAVFAVIVAVAAPVAIMAWGPERPTYTTQNPAPHVTFNSITNNPAHGDERNFVQVKAADAPNSAYAEQVNLEAGKEYDVYIYYHNNAKTSLNASGAGIAQDAYVRAALPAVVDGSAEVVGHVGAANAQPKDVFDEATFKSDGQVALRYVPGSATIQSFGAVDGKKLPDSVVTTGAPLGYDALDGKLPGCEEFAGYVTLRVKADQPNFSVEKTVRKSVNDGGDKEWKETVAAKPGDTVDYQIKYVNTGTTEQKDVVIKDMLPKGMTYVNGSTMYANANNPSGAKATDEVTTTGINVGNYAPKANAFVKFSAKVNASDDLECGNLTLKNVARVDTNNGSKEDDANVTVPGKVCDVAENPVYTCDYLKLIKKESRDTFVFEVKASTEGNASVKEYTIDFGDDQTKTFGPGNETQTHTYAKPGDYTAKATVTFNVDGRTVTGITGDECEVSLNVEATPVTPETPAKPESPKELPSTGPASILAGIVGSSALGYGVHTFMVSRRKLMGALRK